MQSRKSRTMVCCKPYSFGDSIFNKLSIEERCYLDLVIEDAERAEQEGQADRPIVVTQEQVDARIADVRRKKREQRKDHRLLMEKLSGR